MKRSFFIFLVCLLVMSVCSAASAETVKIVTTNFPCYDFVRQVAGDAAEVRMLIRPGVEVHSFEPTPADILAIGDAELFVCIGGESDVWVDGILNSLGDDAPETIRLIESVDTLEGDHAGHDHHDHDALAMDEHVWTSPKNALRMLDAVEEALCAVLPEQEALLRGNAEAYAAEISAIDGELEEILATAERRMLVFADRFPFLYLAHDYDLSYEAAFASCTSEAEASAQTLVRLINIIAENDIPAVYTIEMSNETIARTIAGETGAEILMLHSCQTVTQNEFDAGESYVSLMTKNLEAIRKGLN